MTTQDHAAAMQALRKIVETLIFYASQDSYHACAFLFDPPCGEFSDDFSQEPDSDYDRPMPGKRAREALAVELNLKDVRKPFFEIIAMADAALKLEQALHHAERWIDREIGESWAAHDRQDPTLHAEIAEACAAIEQARKGKPIVIFTCHHCGHKWEWEAPPEPIPPSVIIRCPMCSLGAQC